MNVKMMLVIAGMCLALTAAANASFMEAGCNGSMAAADAISVVGAMPWADTGVMTLASGGKDVDFFSISLIQGQILTVTTTPLTALFATPDTLLGVFDTTQTLAVSDDNSFSGKGSLVQYQAPVNGTYYIAVTGSGDTNFDGFVSGSTGHGKVGAYQLTVSLVPEPASLAIMGLMGIGLLARRKK